jgi:hypothetical protein
LEKEGKRSPIKGMAGRMRSGSGLALALRHRTRTVDGTTGSLGFPRGSEEQHENEHEHEQRNAFVKFLKDLPSWLHVRSAPTGVTGMLPLAEGIQENPKRHLRGEVVCLHYGTIDDAGMRQLEGRS